MPEGGATEIPVVAVEEQLSPMKKLELTNLISQFKDVFNELPGQTRIIHHEICMPPGEIIWQRPYQNPEAHQQAIEEEVARMHQLGVIEPSHSPCSSPVVIVPKKDSTLRYCNDFRRLNEISSFGRYPMPRVDELLE